MKKLKFHEINKKLPNIDIILVILVIFFFFLLLYCFKYLSDKKLPADTPANNRVKINQEKGRENY